MLPTVNAVVFRSNATLVFHVPAMKGVAISLLRVYPLLSVMSNC